MDTNLLHVFFFSLAHVIVPRWNAELSIICIKGLELRYRNHLIIIRNHRAIHYYDLCPTARPKFSNRVNSWTEHPLLSGYRTATVRQLPSLQRCLRCCPSVASSNSFLGKCRRTDLFCVWSGGEAVRDKYWAWPESMLRRGWFGKGQHLSLRPLPLLCRDKTKIRSTMRDVTREAGLATQASSKGQDTVPGTRMLGFPNPVLVRPDLEHCVQLRAPQLKKRWRSLNTSRGGQQS